MKSFNYTIKDAQGIHARPAGVLVKEAGRFKSDITIEKDGKKADAKRIFAVMGLGVKSGETITVNIEGEDEDILVVKIGGEGLYPGERAAVTLDFNLKLPEIRHRFGYQGSRVNLGNWYPIACAF